MVLAGPGSGKTFTITSKISYLIRKQHVRPEDILVITFTRYAAAQMKLRFMDAMEGRHMPVTFGTFHSVYFSILKKAYSLNQENVLSGKEKRALLAHAADAWLPDLDRDDFLRLLEEEIGRVINEGADPDTYHAKCCPDDAFRQIFHGFETEKRRKKKIDFEDMLTKCRDLLLQDAPTREAWQKKFRYILVDEFQDCNRIQYEVLKLLAGQRQNLFVVGDDDQSIYGFRGASPDIMKTFMRDYPNARQILLDRNYRCDAQIVSGSLSVISHNENRFPKDIHAVRTGGDDIQVQGFSDPEEECHFLIKEIQKLMTRGVPAKEIAVLFRIRSEGELLAEQLSRQRIPFQMKEWQNSPYDHFIGKDMRSYLALADMTENACMPDRRADLIRIANRPNRYLTRESMEHTQADKDRLLSWYEGENKMQDRIRKLYTDLSVIKDEPPYSAIQYIRDGIGYEDFLKEYAGSRHVSPGKYLEVLDQIQEQAKEFSTTKEWTSNVDRFGEELKARQEGKEQEGVQLMTIHSAKGLEYDTVFIPGANEGTIPHKKARLPEEIEEERRLFYVAMTRAKHRLFISYAEKKQGRPVQPSRFVEEISQVL